MSDQSLEDILNGVEETTEPTESQEDEVVADEVEESPKAEDEKVEPAATKDEPVEDWTKTAVLDERRKRQALEAEIAELKGSNQAKVEQAEAPNVFEDQDKYTEFLSSQLDQKTQNIKLEMSAEMMRMQDSDYDNKESEFMQLAQENPSLAQKALSHAMPAKFVVDTINKHRELKKLDNVDEYKAQLKAEVEAEVRKEIEAEIQQKREQGEKVSSIRPSLASARSSSGIKDQAIEQSLEEMFGR